MGFYILPITKSAALKEELKADGIVVFQSPSLDLTPSSSPAGDNSALNLLNAAGDILLHISIRRKENAIVFNTKPARGGWGPEEREVLKGRFSGPNTTITVYDHGDRYQILFDYHTVHYYNKRIKTNTASVSYTINDPKARVFDEILFVSTYTSMANLVSGGD